MSEITHQRDEQRHERNNQVNECHDVFIYGIVNSHHCLGHEKHRVLNSWINRVSQRYEPVFWLDVFVGLDEEWLFVGERVKLLMLLCQVGHVRGVLLHLPDREVNSERFVSEDHRLVVVHRVVGVGQKERK